MDRRPVQYPTKARKPFFTILNLPTVFVQDCKISKFIPNVLKF